MRLRFALSRIQACLLALVFACSAYSQSSDLVVDEGSVEKAVTQIESLVSEHLQRIGGDVETQHLNVAFAFNTSHFALDPAPAQAARDIASKFVAERLVAGDRVYSFAWEYGVWDHRPNHPHAMTIGIARADSVNQVTDLWPMTAEAGSIGGKDTEKAIVDVTSKVPAGTVVLLFANNIATVSHGPPTIGQNDPSYQATLTNWDRVGATNKSGASISVEFISSSDGGPPVTRELDVILLVPKQWNAARLVGGTRSELLAKPTPPPVKGKTRSRLVIPPGLAILITLLIVGAVILLIPGLRTGIADFVRGITAAKRWKLTIDGALVSTDGKVDGDTLRTLVGEGLSGEGRIVLTGMPRAELLAVKFSGPGRLTLETKQDVKSWEINGESVTGKSYPLQGEATYQVRLVVSVDSHGVPQDRASTFEIELRKE